MNRLFVLGLVVFNVISFTNLAAMAQTGTPQSNPAEIAARIRPSVFLIWADTKINTGFLICRQPPLVATVAHDVINVEDLSKLVVQANETGVKWKVKAVHLHPEFKPLETDQDPFSADVALLELEENETELGSALVLKNPSATQDLRGQEVLMLGFPFYLIVGLPRSEREHLEAVLRHGIVERHVDFDTSTTSPLAERPMIQSSVLAYQGDSGAPLVDRAGEVIAIQHGVRRIRVQQEVVGRLGMSINVRLLYQLIESTGFADAIRTPQSAP